MNPRARAQLNITDRNLISFFADAFDDRLSITPAFSVLWIRPGAYADTRQDKKEMFSRAMCKTLLIIVRDGVLK
jgi:hypothetical protein